METIVNPLKNGLDTIKTTVTDKVKTFEKPQINIKNKFPKFGSSWNFGSFKGVSSEFWQSNSMVAKFAFLLLVLILSLVALRIGVGIINSILAPSSNPYMVKGMKNARKMHVITQDPKLKGSKPILRSVDEDKGIEFSWSCWIFIDDIHYRSSQYRHIFHKGNDQIKPNGMNFPNNAPGLYIAPNSNNLVVVMNTFKKIKEEIIVEDVPINKWINVIIRCENKNLDVYINGNLIKRYKLYSVPKQNYGDVYVSMNGGFSGYLSNLRYYNEGIGLREIQSIVADGPNLDISDESDIKNSNPPYLSLKWIFASSKDR